MMATARRPTARKPAGAIDWADQAACKDEPPNFVDMPLADTLPVCRVCPVRRNCHKAGLTPQQIQAMP